MLSQLLQRNNEWKDATQFKVLASILVVMGDKAPNNELLEMMEMVIRKCHAPPLPLHQNLDLRAVFIQKDLPSLLVPQLQYINPEDREKYTICIINDLLRTRRLIFTAYIKDSQYIHNLLQGHGLSTIAQYCGRILEKFMEDKEIKKEVVSNPNLIKLVYYAKESEFLIQEQSLKTLKITLDENGGATLSFEVAVDIMNALTGLANTENMVLKAISLETLAFLLKSQKELCSMFASKTGIIEDLIKTLPQEDVQVQRSQLMLLTVLQKCGINASKSSDYMKFIPNEEDLTACNQHKDKDNSNLTVAGIST